MWRVVDRPTDPVVLHGVLTVCSVYTALAAGGVAICPASGLPLRQALVLLLRASKPGAPSGFMT